MNKKGCQLRFGIMTRDGNGWCSTQLKNAMNRLNISMNINYFAMML